MSNVFIFDVTMKICIYLYICVNDSTETNVKNVCDYAEYCKDSVRRDRAVIVVNHHRELIDFQHLMKEELNKMNAV